MPENQLRSIAVELFGRLPVSLGADGPGSTSCHPVCTAAGDATSHCPPRRRRNCCRLPLPFLTVSASASLTLQVAELPKPLIPQLMDACHAILSIDSEENGMVAQRVLFDMHKTYKQALEEQSGPFFTWLQQVRWLAVCCAGGRVVRRAGWRPPRGLQLCAIGGVCAPCCLHSSPNLLPAHLPCPPVCACLSACLQLYSNLPQEFAAKLGPGAQAGDGGGQVPANRSFKLASEVALMIVFLFQCHPRRLQENAATLLPLMVKVRAQQGLTVGERQAGMGLLTAAAAVGRLQPQSALQGGAGAAACDTPAYPLPHRRCNLCHSTTPPALPQVASIPGPGLSEVVEGRIAVYNDFRMAQIKSLAFLTVIARSSNLQPLMQPHKDAICGAIVRVMQTVPDVLTTRKELLIALRNILPTPFR